MIDIKHADVIPVDGVDEMEPPRINQTKGPCKDCVDRHLSCWTLCVKYNEYRRKLAQEHAARKGARGYNERERVMVRKSIY